MTAGQLIKELKKFPPESIVAWQDHDHGDEEFNGFVGKVDESSDYLKSQRGIDVVIRS